MSEEILSRIPKKLKTLSFKEVILILLFFLIPFLGDLLFNTDALWFLAIIPSIILAYHFGLNGGIHTERVNRDSLTDLYNHRYFYQKLDENILKAITEHNYFSLITGNIDFFKKYNTTNGHLAGDEVLKQIARLLKKNNSSQENVTARFGGDEFIMLLWGSNKNKAVNVADQLRCQIEKFPFAGKETQPLGSITMSFGIASFPEDATDKNELIEKVESALSQAKVASKNSVGSYYSVIDALSNNLHLTGQEIISSLRALINIINAKDHYTYEHSKRVANYSVKLGEKLGLPENTLNLLEIGGFLHDIGKIEISEKILKKPGYLSQFEFEIIKRHTVIGGDMIKSIDNLKVCEKIALYHHERYDGRGYPEGLSGKNIPLLARIVMLADSFDAMTTDRPYKKGKTLNEAIEEIELNSGTQFDPEIVPYFIEILEKTVAIDQKKYLSN